MNIDTSDYQPRTIEDFGWNPFFKKHFQALKIPDSVPARVTSESKGSFQVYSQYGELAAKISGKMRYRAGEEKQYPAVGDWVVVKPLITEQKGIIHAILPRKSKFSRKVAGERAEEQIVSTNIDTVFIVSGLDGGRNFNLRRIENYLTKGTTAAFLGSSGVGKSALINALLGVNRQETGEVRADDLTGKHTTT